MATSGLVAIKMESGEILSCYNNFDSFPDILGVYLQNYKTYDEVLNLINRGYISETDNDEYHESLKKKFVNIKEWIDSFSRFDAVYSYIFDGGVWKCHDTHGFEVVIPEGEFS